ncbi:hypothetical protein ACVWXN_002820 [Bradyrhizobium sp. i1.4.4]
MMNQTCSTPIIERFADADRRGRGLAGLGLVLDAEHAEAVAVAERILALEQRRRRGQGDDGAVPLDLEGQRRTRIHRNDSLHVGKALDRLAVDLHDDVADLEAGRGRSAVGDDAVDAGDRARLAVIERHGGEDQCAQDEIGDRSGRNDGGARADLLVMEAAGALLGRHGRERLGRRGRSLALVAEELDVAAERDRRDLPAGAMAVVETDQLRSETEREGQHPNARPARDQEMAEFMEEHDDRQDEQEGNRVAEEPMAQRIETMDEKVDHRIPSSSAARPWPRAI